MLVAIGPTCAILSAHDPHLVQEAAQHPSGLEVLPGDLDGLPRVPLIIAVDPRDAVERLFGARERDQTGSGREVRRPARVLDERGASRREVTRRAIAEPARAARHVGVFRHAELGLRAMDEVAIVPEAARHAHRVDCRPAMLAQQPLRAVDRQLERLAGARRQVDEADELLILVAADVGEALDLPRHDAGEPIARRDVRPPVLQRHRLPRLVPREPTDWHGGRRRPDIGAEREEMGETLEEGDIPGFGLGDGELGERGVGVDESGPRDSRVFVAPEP